MPDYHRFLNKIENFSLPNLKQILNSFINEQKDIKSSLNILPLGYFYLDKNHKITFANDYAKKYFLKSSVKKEKSLFSSLSNASLSCQLKKKILLDKNFRDTEIKITHKDQNTSLSVSCYSISEKEEIIGYTLLLINAIHWKEKYQQQNIRNSIESLATLTSGIAHEIKNPLGAIDLHLQLIDRHLKKEYPQDEYFSDLTKVVKDEINRLDKIVNDFLLSVRPINIKKELINLNDIVVETLKFMEPVFNDSNINISSELNDEIPLYLFDKYSIKQVLINLLKNSIESIKENKNDINDIHIKTFSDAYTIFLEIRDTGIGIKEKEINQIFDPYFTTKKMGTGLGLSIASNIINKHNGSIDVSSTVGKGTKIELSFDFNKKKILLGT